MIGISLGDITGVGPEVTLKALAAEASADETRYLLIGDAEHLRHLNQQLGLQLPLQSYTGAPEGGRFFLHNPLAEALPGNLVAGWPSAGRGGGGGGVAW